MSLRCPGRARLPLESARDNKTSSDRGFSIKTISPARFKLWEVAMFFWNWIRDDGSGKFVSLPMSRRAGREQSLLRGQLSGPVRVSWWAGGQVDQ